MTLTSTEEQLVEMAKDLQMRLALGHGKIAKMEKEIESLNKQQSILVQANATLNRFLKEKGLNEEFIQFALKSKGVKK